MDITEYSESLRRDLAQAAEAGSDEVRQAAERLALALDPAIRLTLMDALSQAAADITNELDGTTVDVRLKGREPVFVVTGGVPAPPEAPEPFGPGSPAEPADEEGQEDGAVARITLRLPESLKVRAEEIAASRGQSLNTWLVNAARMVASNPDFNLNISSTGISMGMGPGAPGRNRSSNKRIQGWVR
ncbi:MAG: pilus assembly protein HicB [Nocardioidaceae bacterium]|nr:pilus assembly protein HicB [Nocardioidaceae bacterium]